MGEESSRHGNESVSADRFDEEAVFNKARCIVDPGQRAFYIQQVCPDGQIRARIEALLGVHDQDPSFLDSPVEVVEPEATDVVYAEEPGASIGPYKLREQIGEGGFGIVYVADQSEPVRRRVALKIIKPGMDTRDVIARFEAERQALAMMDHPNIAKVLDAGTTESGRPYFAMELVHGIPITDFCDQQQLATRERLELFVDVCRAVQHAHQKGIIHRDLKPSNVMVTMHDDRPVAKVIDFGVAKAIGYKLSDVTIYTAYGQMVGSPLYMSPEQAQLSGLDVDTRSDVYSLGVLLYELLIGTTPFDKETFKRVGFDEMRRMIREAEPPSPSARISTLAANVRSTVADRRKVDPRKLSQSLRGDLDWIVMKCLEKDRTRRYETANGLCRDIQRYLADEPVEACPPSAGYRLKKFIRRNKVTATFIALLTIGVAALAVSNVIIKRERDAKSAALSEKDAALALALENERRATTESAKTKAIADFLQEMLASANPAQAKGADYTVRQLLDDFSAGLGDQLADEPEVEATLRATIGRAFWRLGMTELAEPHLKLALELRQSIFGPDHPSVAESLVDYAWNLAESTRYEEAIDKVEMALAIYRRNDSPREPMLNAMWALERFLVSQHEFDEVEAVAKEALAIAGDLDAVQYPVVANILHGLGDARLLQERYAESETVARDAVALHRRLHGEEHPETAWALLVLGRALQGQRKLTDAETTLREALTIFRKQFGNDYKGVTLASNDLADVSLSLRMQLQGSSTVDYKAVARDVSSSSVADQDTWQLRWSAELLNRCVTAAEQDVNAPSAERDAFVDEQARRIDELLSLAVERCPDEPYQQNGLAWWLVIQGEPRLRSPASAVELAEKTVARNPIDFTHWKTLALARYRAGNDEGAIEAAQQSMKLIGAHCHNLIVLAMAQCRRGNMEQALMWHTVAALRMPRYGGGDIESSKLHTEMIDVLKSTGFLDQMSAVQPRDLIEQCTQLIETEPDSVWPYQLRGQLYGDGGHFDAARDDYRSAFESLARNRQVSLEAERRIVQLAADVNYWRQWGLVAAAYSRAIELNPETWRYYQERSYAYTLLQDYRAALADCNRGLDLDPEQGDLWARRGYLNWQLGQHEQALADLNKGFELVPNHSWEFPWTERYSLLLELGEWEEAADDLERFIQSQPGNAVPRYRLALARLSAGNTEEYRKLCRAMVDHFRDTSDVTAAHWVAWTCVLAPDALEDLSPAIALAETAVTAEPDNLQYLTSFGAILFRAGRFEDAAEYLSEVDRRLTESSGSFLSSPAYVWFFLALIHDRLGEKDEAARWWSKAVRHADQELQAGSSSTQTSAPWNRRLTLQLLSAEAEALGMRSEAEPASAN